MPQRFAWWMVIALMSGCGGGPSLVPVTGKVTLDGQPLGEGMISFESREQGFAGSASLQPDGSFKVQCQYGRGLPAGHYQVTINPPPFDLQPGKPAPPASSIPKKYRSVETSGLEADVQKGSAPFRFDLAP